MTTVNLVNPFWGLAVSETTHWRITALGPHAVMRVAEVEMAAFVGGPNLCTGGTPGAENFDTGLNAFDGNTATDDVSPIINPAWPRRLTYTFSTPQAVRSVRLRASATTPADMPDGWCVGYSMDSGSTWQAARIIVDTAAWSAGEQREYAVDGIATVTKATALIWRFRSIVGGVSGNAISELYARASSGGPQLFTGGTPFADAAVSSTVPADRAVDGNTGTFWQGGSDFYYSTPTPINPSFFAMRSRNTDGVNRTPTEFALDYGDGENWTEALYVSGLAPWGNGETREWAIP